MDKNKLFDEKKISKGLGVWAPWKKFCQKTKHFEIFFDVIDNHTFVHIHNKKNFKFFHFSAKCLNYLEGPSVDFFKTLNFQLPHDCVNWIWIDFG